MTPTAVVERFAELLGAGDAEGALELYAEDAAFVVEPGRVVTGLDAILEALQDFAALRPTLRGDVEQVVVVDDVALVANRWTLDGTTPAGDAVHQEGRSADVLRRDIDGDWRIAIDDPFGGGR